MNFSINSQVYNARSFTPDHMAEAVAKQTGKPVTPELVEAMKVALKEVPQKDRLDGKLVLDSKHFGTLLGKVDGPKLELVESSGAKKRSESRGELLQRAVAPDDLFDDFAISGPPTKEQFHAKLDGITTKGEVLFDKLNDDLRSHIVEKLPTAKAEKSELKDLLHFGKLKLGETTEDQRVEIRALLLSAFGLGVSEEDLASLKETLRNGTPQQARDLLAAIKDPEVLIPHFDGELVPVHSSDIPQMTVEHPSIVDIAPTTMKNLEVAQKVNMAVKSLLSGGAPNQAPDLYRTNGQNVLLHSFMGKVNPEFRDPTGSVKHLEGVDAARKKNGTRFGNNDSLAALLSKAQSATVLGTGKCGEHAAVAMSLLTDPATLKQLGVALAPGSMILLTWGDKIDHNYVMIAEPGSVELRDLAPGKDRRITVKDPNKIVVVDPWMPIPVAHTLDRCNDEIQTKDNSDVDPRWVIAVQVGDDGSLQIVDKDTDHKDVVTPLTSSGKTSMLDQLQGLQEEFRPATVQRALILGIVSLEKQETLGHGSGIAVRDGAGKAGMYHETHTSSKTPDDGYQVVKDGTQVGAPKKLLVAQKSYLDKENPSIKRGLEKPVKQTAREHLDHMPPDVREKVQEALA